VEGGVWGRLEEKLGLGKLVVEMDGREEGLKVEMEGGL
jgi:hypothetical protein